MKITINETRSSVNIYSELDFILFLLSFHKHFDDQNKMNMLKIEPMSAKRLLLTEPNRAVPIQVHSTLNQYLYLSLDMLYRAVTNP